MSGGGAVSDGPSDVAVSPLARPAADVRWQQTARRLSAVALLCAIVVIGAVGGVKALFFSPAAESAAPPNFSVQGASVEARMLDLATSCLRDANNYDEQQHAADLAAGDGPLSGPARGLLCLDARSPAEGLGRARHSASGRAPRRHHLTHRRRLDRDRRHPAAGQWQSPAAVPLLLRRRRLPAGRLVLVDDGADRSEKPRR